MVLAATDKQKVRVPAAALTLSFLFFKDSLNQIKSFMMHLDHRPPLFPAFLLIFYPLEGEKGAGRKPGSPHLPSPQEAVGRSLWVSFPACPIALLFFEVYTDLLRGAAGNQHQ